MRWLYHALPRHEAAAVLSGDGPLAPPSLETEGFVHTSYRDVARASAELYVGGDAVVLAIDPRRLGRRVDVAETPRGPMPHVMGDVPRAAITRALELAELPDADDTVKGTRFGFVAFEGMTLLDLVGVLDPVSRLASMGFDPTSTCEVVAGTPRTEVWAGHSATLAVARVRPDLMGFDVLVVPGGPGARALTGDEDFLAWLGTYPRERLAASVCTGSLLWAAEGRLRGKRAATHASAHDVLTALGATWEPDARVVCDPPVVSAAGVTAALDLGLALVHAFGGDEARARISRQMELPEGYPSASIT
jgi:cyclohexyl-isocyanide hydratase